MENEILTPRLLIAKDILCTLINVHNDEDGYRIIHSTTLIKDSLKIADELLRLNNEL